MRIQPWISLAFVLSATGFAACLDAQPSRHPIELPPISTLADSSDLRRAAVHAVDLYERSAAFYWSPRAVTCQYRDRGCGGGHCVPASPDIPCIAGRQRPCFLPPVQRIGLARVCFDRDRDAPISDSTFRDWNQVQRDAREMMKYLTEVLRRIPGDLWVRQQLVWYELYLGAGSTAVELADECVGGSYACKSLSAFAVARSVGLAAAAPQLRSALDAADPQTRCRLESVEDLLPDSLALWYRNQPCDSDPRSQFEHRLWWLADPSWMSEGNERCAEHYIRQIERTILEAWGGSICSACKVATNRSDTLWWDDLATSPRQLTRGGVNDAFWRIPDAFIQTRGQGGARLSRFNPGKHTRSTRSTLHFVPSQNALANPWASTESDWQLTAGPPANFADRPGPVAEPMPERFSPATLMVSSITSRQVAFFERGDSMAIAVSWRTPTIGSNPAAGNLFVFGKRTALRSPTDRIELVRSADGHWTYLGLLPTDSVLLGLEVLTQTATPSASASPSARLSRSRFAAAPPRRDTDPRLSDILLFDPRGPDEATLPFDSVLARMRGTTTAVVGTSLGLYWELYGASPSDSMELRLQLTERRNPGSSLLRRLFGGRSAASWAVSWRERGASAIAKSLALRIPDDLSPGEYDLRLTFRQASGRTAHAVRMIHIVKTER